MIALLMTAPAEMVRQSLSSLMTCRHKSRLSTNGVPGNRSVNRCHSSDRDLSLSRLKLLSMAALQQIRISALFRSLPQQTTRMRVSTRDSCPLLCDAHACKEYRRVRSLTMIIAALRCIMGIGVPVRMASPRVQRADAAPELMSRLLEGLRCCLVQVNRVVQLQSFDAVSR